MILSAKQSSTSRYSGKVLLAALMLVFVCIACSVFMSYGAIGKCDGTDARLAALNSVKVIKDKPMVGVVRAVVYNPSSPSAIVDDAIVHVGDTIHDVAVVGIDSDKVEFAKDGVSWQQAVLDAPNAAWTNPAKDNSPTAK
jgi:hypothetical protein